MADNAKTAGKAKKGFFQGVKSEFEKIIWTDKQTLVKQTIAVVVITVILGVIISLLDSGVLAGLNLLMK